MSGPNSARQSNTLDRHARLLLPAAPSRTRSTLLSGVGLPNTGGDTNVKSRKPARMKAVQERTPEMDCRITKFLPQWMRSRQSPETVTDVPDRMQALSVPRADFTPNSTNNPEGHHDKSILKMVDGDWRGGSDELEGSNRYT